MKQQWRNTMKLLLEHEGTRPNFHRKDIEIYNEDFCKDIVEWQHSKLELYEQLLESITGKQKKTLFEELEVREL